MRKLDFFFLLQIISSKFDMDEGTNSNTNMGEICAHLMNFVVCNTNQKRSILESVPSSVLNKMSSKERSLHNESVKKQLKGIV